MYWNFAIPGVLIGSALFGLLLRRLYSSRAQHLAGNPDVALMYCIVMFRFGGDAMTGGIGYAIFNALLSAAGIYGLLLCVKVQRRGPRRVWQSTARGQWRRAVLAEPTRGGFAPGGDRPQSPPL